jgi:hypothetical protein
MIIKDFAGYVIGWDEEDEAPESNDSDGDFVPPIDGDDDAGEDSED